MSQLKNVPIHSKSYPTDSSQCNPDSLPVKISNDFKKITRIKYAPKELMKVLNKKPLESINRKTNLKVKKDKKSSNVLVKVGFHPCINLYSLS